jgi:DNA-binding response OmpR family regulator
MTPTSSVRRLRQKIGPDPHAPRYLITERGAGYRFGVA